MKVLLRGEILATSRVCQPESEGGVRNGATHAFSLCALAGDNCVLHHRMQVHRGGLFGLAPVQQQATVVILDVAVAAAVFVFTLPFLHLSSFFTSGGFGNVAQASVWVKAKDLTTLVILIKEKTFVR